ncbi:hypothetical protein GQ43DRAFT_89299 [Delitschia confertaspora ATCC 74209]|uniref:Uncharacterized protein n=1 Tax=Delitschia confertaspora ATCC 74209 TaxID=1513339 RepID=A0A9P4MXP0_9PLEO|nr:hypothetical protein GQ43DRAFT_89299 [Delitschia confertaspora ATCC 74209]
MVFHLSFLSRPNVPLFQRCQKGSFLSSSIHSRHISSPLGFSPSSLKHDTKLTNLANRSLSRTHSMCTKVLIRNATCRHVNPHPKTPIRLCSKARDRPLHIQCNDTKTIFENGQPFCKTCDYRIMNELHRLLRAQRRGWEWSLSECSEEDDDDEMNEHLGKWAEFGISERV